MVVSGVLKRNLALFATVGVMAAVGASAGAADGSQSTMQLSCEAFADGGKIPAKFTCDDKNLSPALKWSGAPAGTKSFALVVDDPDAPMGTWVHWVLYDLPANAAELSEGVPKTETIPAGGKQGVNDFKQIGYGGPCPPPAKAHRYMFKLYALDTALDLKPGATKKQLEHAMVRHILAQAQLIGTYKRK
jgi:Raf kinase inhibitor-like YbhB/YbcL family protein